jgi:hypothetical protein
MVSRLAALVLTSLIAAACGATQPYSTSVTGAPSATTTLEAACPTDPPADFAVEPRNGNAYLSWGAVTAAESYEIEIHAMDSAALLERRTLRDTRWEWAAHGLGQGPYRARVRALMGCGMSSWSPEDTFILNRSGGAGEFAEAAPAGPAPAAAAPASVASNVTPRPLATCGSLSGPYAADFRGVLFRTSAAPASRAVSIPAGTYRVDVETFDPAHRPGFQAYQTSERLTLSVRGADGTTETIGTTRDIPDDATSMLSSFTVTLRATSDVLLAGASSDSVHGACVVWTPL